MKKINIISIIQAYKNSSGDVFEKYLKYIKTKPKSHEIDDLEILIKELLHINSDIHIYNQFYFGYSIPQISKEFDLLRFGVDYIINIELKRSSDENKIKKQLLENRHYLKFLNSEIFSYTFITSTRKLYTIDGIKLKEVSLKELVYKLNSQKVKSIDDIDKLFNPSDYLVSPFNSTKNFMEGEYFLTSQQDKIKKDTINCIDKNIKKFISISGRAGTGKSIITYDIAKHYISQGKNVIVIHCGYLNSGHELLNDVYNWKVMPVKEIGLINYSKNDVIIVDESQRIRVNSIKHIINNVNSNEIKCIFSFDSQQCLHNDEVRNNIEGIISSLNPLSFELTEKIRTNEEIASFIKCLFDKARPIHKDEPKNVEINYFNNTEDALDFLELLKTSGWKVINYTPSQYYTEYFEKYKMPFEDSVHRVIGQEFDNVVGIIDKHFYYNGDKLSTKGYSRHPYYNHTKMLFQILTRTRRRLNIIIIENDEIMDRCLDILKYN